MRKSRIVGSGTVNQKDVLAVLTEDIENHRRFIHFLYTRTLVVAGVLFGAAAIFATWFLGDKYEDSLLRAVVNKDLNQEVEILISTQTEILIDKIDAARENAVAASQLEISDTAENARREAQSEFERFVENEIFNTVRANITPQIEELQRTSLSDLVSSIELPSGLIAAFSTQHETPSGCPLGWEFYRHAGGRFLVGAGNHANRDASGRSLNIYSLSATGGQELVELTIPQMPGHRHSFQDFFYLQDAESARLADVQTQNIVRTNDGASGGDRNNVGWYRESLTNSQGSGEGHNNVPPFVAVLFCIKR